MEREGSDGWWSCLTKGSWTVLLLQLSPRQTPAQLKHHVVRAKQLSCPFVLNHNDEMSRFPRCLNWHYTKMSSISTKLWIQDETLILAAPTLSASSFRASISAWTYGIPSAFLVSSMICSISPGKYILSTPCILSHPTHRWYK